MKIFFLYIFYLPSSLMPGNFFVPCSIYVCLIEEHLKVFVKILWKWFMVCSEFVFSIFQYKVYMIGCGNSLTMFWFHYRNSLYINVIYFRFQVKKKRFFVNFITIMSFGAVGTLISCSIITFGMSFLFIWILTFMILFLKNLHRENSDGYFKQTIPYPCG